MLAISPMIVCILIHLCSKSKFLRPSSFLLGKSNSAWICRSIYWLMIFIFKLSQIILYLINHFLIFVLGLYHILYRNVSFGTLEGFRVGSRVATFLLYLLPEDSNVYLVRIREQIFWRFCPGVGNSMFIFSVAICGWIHNL